MSCSADVASNMQKAIAGIREAAAKGAQIVCLQELFTSLYFCDVEDHENFKLAEAIPDHRQIPYRLLPKNWALSLSLHYLRKEPLDYIITLRQFWMLTERI
jgi:hypothetical protein